jgi:hypothetical protein
VSGGASAAPPPKTTAPASWRLALPWVSRITWGGLVGDMGHRKGQLLRVLGSSPSASAFRAPHHHHGRTKGPRTGGPPAPPPRARFFFAKVTSYISEGTKH